MRVGLLLESEGGHLENCQLSAAQARGKFGGFYGLGFRVQGLGSGFGVGSGNVRDGYNT